MLQGSSLCNKNTCHTGTCEEANDCYLIKPGIRFFSATVYILSHPPLQFIIKYKCFVLKQSGETRLEFSVSVCVALTPPCTVRPRGRGVVPACSSIVGTIHWKQIPTGHRKGMKKSKYRQSTSWKKVALFFWRTWYYQLVSGLIVLVSFELCLECCSVLQ